MFHLRPHNWPQSGGRVGWGGKALSLALSLSRSLAVVLPRSHAKISGLAPSTVQTEWHKRDKASGTYFFFFFLFLSCRLAVAPLDPQLSFVNWSQKKCVGEGVGLSDMDFFLLGSGWIPSLYCGTMTTLAFFKFIKWKCHMSHNYWLKHMTKLMRPKKYTIWCSKCWTCYGITKCTSLSPSQIVP